MRKDNEKKVYELWWKYLQQSEGYRQWLEIELSDYLAFVTDVSKPRDAVSYPVPEKFKSTALLGSGGWQAAQHRPDVKNSNKNQSKWINLYWRTGDIRDKTFEEWWKEREEWLKDNLVEPPVDEYANRVGADILECWKYHYVEMVRKGEKGEQIEANLEDAEKFKERFVKSMRESDLLHLVVNPDGDLNTLKAELVEMVNEKRQRQKGWYKAQRRYRLLIAGKLRLEELGRYLQVYILRREGIEWRKIISQFEPRRLSGSNQGGYENTRRTYERYAEKAARIIENAENGQFPGEYTD
jgi:hypothetical protein